MSDASFPQSPWLQRLRRWDWETIALLLGIKAFLLFLGLQTFTVANQTPSGVLAIWNRWDAMHYVRLAEHGYVNVGHDRTSLVFFPLYPWLVRAAHFVVRDYLLAAFVVSGLAVIAAAILLRRLAGLDQSPAVARGAVWFFAIFPTAYFLHIPYTESLFLALCLGCVLSVRRDRWMLAGLLGAAASFTRVNGLVLLPVLATEALLQYRLTRRLNPRWLWTGLIGCGFGAYLWLNYHVTGDPFAFSKIMAEVWYKKLTPPWTGIWDVWLRVGGVNDMEGLQEFLYIILTFACTVWCWVKLRPSYAVWMTCNWLLITSTSFVLSVPRYALTLFPIFILFARAAHQRRLVWQLLSASSLLLMAFYVTRFVQGLWAF